VNETVLEQGKEIAAEATRAARESAKAASRDLRDLCSDSAPGIGEGWRRLRDWTRDNTGLGLTCAVAVGLLIGLVLRRGDD
jgi:hypothetical protein